MWDRYNGRPLYPYDGVALLLFKSSFLERMRMSTAHVVGVSVFVRWSKRIPLTMGETRRLSFCFVALCIRKEIYFNYLHFT